MSYSVKTIGHRWANQAVPFKTLEQAMAHAKRISPDCIEVQVYSHRTEDGATGWQGAIGVVIATM